jgi:hypothetical protein
LVKTITGVMTRGDQTRQIVTQIGTTAGGRIQVSVAIVVTGVTVTTETVITATTGGNHASLLDTKTK